MEMMGQKAIRAILAQTVPLAQKAQPEQKEIKEIRGIKAKLVQDYKLVVLSQTTPLFQKL
jgi:hypothetical protein